MKEEIQKVRAQQREIADKRDEDCNIAESLQEMTDESSQQLETQRHGALIH